MTFIKANAKGIKSTFILSFDYSNKENYFFPDKIEILKQIEKELIVRKYLDLAKGWIVEKTKLVAFIYFLKQMGYLRPKLKGKDEKASLLVYRRFFEKRYHINITRAMKPTEFKLSGLKNYKADFLFIIPEIDN